MKPMSRNKRFQIKLLGSIFLVIFCATSVFATPKDASASDVNKTPENTGTPPIADTSGDSSSLKIRLDHSFTWAAFALTHKALKNSKELHNWPFFPLAFPVAWNTTGTIQKDFGRFITLKGLADGNLSIMDMGINLDAALELMHLLELGVSGNIHSSFNYGDYATFMGVYNPEKGNFDGDTFLTFFAYGAKFRVVATIPLIAFLPKSDWTKIILRPNVSWTYTAYTDADDGEIWKCGSEYSANGWRYRYGGTLIYILPFKRIPMLMVNVNASNFFRSTKFDEVYDGYDPYFTVISIMPMLSVKISDDWSGMLLTAFNRDRAYEKYHYEATEELLQNRKGHEWGMKVIMMTFTRKF